MKNIILIISVLISFAVGNVETEISRSFKKLGKCDISNGKEALEMGLSAEGIELHKYYSGAVYFWCDKGYIFYVQDDVKGSLLRGQVCNIGQYDYVEGCSSSSAWFMLDTFRDSTDGYFLEDDKYEMRVKDERYKDTKYNSKKMFIRLYNLLRLKYK